MRIIFFLKVILPGFFCLFFSCILQAQSSGEIQSLKLAIPGKTEYSYVAYSQEDTGRTDVYSGMMFRFYKMYISSQDYGKCSFTPSCSEYAIIAIRKQGIVVGSINTLDRLTRCHSGNIRNYLPDEKTGLSVDEVRNLRYEKD
ncbi:MAG: membrane protein insertion efficiency factor YidD [Bacteroidales bacterium]|nr:membrane protein insertion efficiency factor YidD [Bacteroidales bacterium]